MRNTAITTETIAKYQHPHVKLTVAGTSIPTKDIVAGSFSYKGGASSGGTLEPGGCIIGSVGFALYNYDGKYTDLITDGATVSAYIGYGTSPDTATWAKCAQAYVSEWTIKRGTITVTAYDDLRKADKTMWPGPSSWPTTVKDIINSATEAAGITLKQSPPSGGGISVDLRTKNEDGTYTDPDISMTCRQAISEALKLSGNFGYCDYSGGLVCDWFDWDDPALTITDTFSASFASAKSYTGIQVGTRDVVGSDEYMFALSSNNFLTDDNAEAVESRLYNALVGHTFDVGTAGILQNINLQPGDVVTLVTPMGTKKIPITSIALKDSMIEQITCEANSYDAAEDQRQDASNNALAEDVLGGDFNFDTSALETQIEQAQTTADKALAALGGYSIAVLSDTQWAETTPANNTVYFIYNA